MSAEIIQFVPKPNPNREKAISETLEQMAAKWVTELHDLGDTAPCEIIPSGECTVKEMIDFINEINAPKGSA